MDYRSEKQERKLFKNKQAEIFEFDERSINLLYFSSSKSVSKMCMCCSVFAVLFYQNKNCLPNVLKGAFAQQKLSNKLRQYLIRKTFIR